MIIENVAVFGFTGGFAFDGHRPPRPRLTRLEAPDIGTPPPQIPSTADFSKA
jgi:hypothetical protein